MTKLIAIPKQARLKSRGYLKKTRKKTAGFVNPSKSIEVRYRKQLIGIYAAINADIKRDLFTALRALENQFVSDSYSITLQEVFAKLRRGYSDIGSQAASISAELVGKANANNRQRFYKAMESAIGVNVGAVIQSENLTDILNISNRENVNLISTIPEKYLSSVESIVFNNVTQSSSAESIIQQISKLNKSNIRRAKVIARDQTSKLNAALSKARQQNLGVTEYVWRTAGDGRVRSSHAANNGKVFRWDSPPETGHPSQDIQCRCIAQPVIKI